MKIGPWHHQVEEKTSQEKVRVNTKGFPSPREFSKFCIMVEAKIITLSTLVLNVHRGNSEDIYIINRGGQRDVKGRKISILT